MIPNGTMSRSMSTICLHWANTWLTLEHVSFILVKLLAIINQYRKNIGYYLAKLQKKHENPTN
jgi:hypothetical protein